MGYGHQMECVVKLTQSVFDCVNKTRKIAEGGCCGTSKCLICIFGNFKIKDLEEVLNCNFEINRDLFDDYFKIAYKLNDDDEEDEDAIYDETQYDDDFDEDDEDGRRWKKIWLCPARGGQYYFPDDFKRVVEREEKRLKRFEILDRLRTAVEIEGRFSNWWLNIMHEYKDDPNVPKCPPSERLPKRLF